MSTTRKKSARIGPQIIAGLRGVVHAIKAGGMDEVAREHTVLRVHSKALKPRFTRGEIAAIRAQFRVNQAGFALFLGVSASEVKRWEANTSAPTGAASRLLDELRRDPDYWKNRFNEILTDGAIP